MEDLLIKMMRLGQSGHSCSQILMLLALEEHEQTNPGLVRAMAGLAYGCGSGGATCGVLTGGSCLLAFLAAHDSASDQPSEKLSQMLQELTDWFDEHVGKSHGGTTCDIITGEAGPAACRQICGTILADTYIRVIEIAQANGFDL